MTMRTATALIIMDGCGIGPETAGNAVFLADTPNLDRLLRTCPSTTLEASGTDVGLPVGQIGNSEVGHTNIGAGRVVFQDLPRITNAIEDGSFFTNDVYCSAINSARDSGKALHLFGLLSDGGVHSHINHLFALLELAKRRGLSRVYIHAALDGRDVGPSTGLGYVRACMEKCAQLGVGRIATVQGRFYAMDRDKRWERLQRAYDAMVRGRGVMEADPVKAVEASYACGITDEFVEPIVCDSDGVIKNGDSVIFFNFRPDRARELCWALTGFLPEDAQMDTDSLSLNFACTTQYDEALDLPIAFPPEALEGTFGEYVSSLGLHQLRIAETEKYAHVTFFFNGGAEKVYPGEDRVLIPSPKEFATYDLVPEMSARAVTDETVSRIKSGQYDIVIVNLANCDMVGHTGVLEAAVKAVETVDECVGRIVEAVSDRGGISLITADHGNADVMITPEGEINTAHTTNPVPLIIVGADAALKKGRLADIAPTMLDLMGLEKPAEMTGESLIIR